MLFFEQVQVVKELFFVQFEQVAPEVVDHMGQAAGVIVQGTLALAGQFHRPFQLRILLTEMGVRIQGRVQDCLTFFSYLLLLH